MSHPLAFANQSLYHAGILLSAWSHAKASGEAPERAITLAFAAPVQARLLDGYGWLLLAACRIRQAPETPPHSVDNLPPIPAGLVLPAEVTACAELELNGWIADLRSPIDRQPTVRPANSLAVEVATSLEQFQEWSTRLKDLAAQIADAIDES